MSELKYEPLSAMLCEWQNYIDKAYTLEAITQVFWAGQQLSRIYQESVIRLINKIYHLLPHSIHVQNLPIYYVLVLLF